MGPRSRLPIAWLLLALTGGVEATPQGLSAEDAALLLSGQEGGTLALASGAVVWSAEGDRAELRISLELPIDGLAEGEAEQVTLRWAIYALDEGGTLIASRVQSVTADRVRLAGSGMVGARLVESLEVPLAPVSIRTLVRELGSSRFGLRVVAVNAAAGPGPFAAARREGWIDLGTPTPGPQPAALTAVRAGDELEILLPTEANQGSDGWVFSARREAESEEEPVPAVAAPAAAQGSGRQRLAVTVPDDLQGHYTLHRRSDPSDTGPSLLILPAATTGAVAWPQAADRTAEPTLREAIPAGQGRLRDAGVRRGLLWKLTTAAEEGVDSGAEALLEIFDEAWATAGESGVATVVEEAFDLCFTLVQAEPASLPALLAVFDRLSELCVSPARKPCSGPARLLVPGLLEGGEKIAPREARSMADAWTVLGWRSLERRSYAQATEQLRRASQLNSDRPEVQIALAGLYELRGEYRPAASVLEKLLQRHPTAHEARLRLGIQYRRLGRRDAARETLASLADEAPEWTRVVAAEELAALHRDRGETQRAEEALRHAIGQFPDQGQLTLQLAALLDSSGQFAQASALLDELGEPIGRDRAPRNRYARLPDTGLEDAYRRLRETATERLAALSSALRAAVR